MNHIQVEMLMGLGGHATSSGIDDLAKLIQALNDKNNYVIVEVRAWDDWKNAGAILKASGNKKVIIGYSNGGSEVTGISDMAFPIDLLISLDPTIWINCSPLHDNVKEAICFHNANWLSSIPPVGHNTLTTASDWKPLKQKLTIIDIYDLHMNVDKDKKIQDTCLSAIEKLKV